MTSPLSRVTFADGPDGAVATVDLPRRYNAAVDLVDRHLGTDHRDRIAYRDDRGRASFAELAARVDRAGHALRALGVDAEQRVLLVLLDTIDFPVLFLAA